MSLEIPCILQKVIYRKPDGFAILAVDLNANSSLYKPEMEEQIKKNCDFSKYNNFTITVGMFDKGAVESEGQQFVFIGEFSVHKKYGRQFRADFYYQDIPETEDGFRHFLMSLPNIKEVRSKEIIDKFGIEGTIDILDNDPYRLTEINGITEKRIPPIKEAWNEQKTLRELYEFLAQHNIDLKMARRVYKQFGEKSLLIIKENPYKICEIKGIGFITADTIACKIFKEMPKEKRLTACMIYVLNENTRQNSNLCIPWTDLKKSVIELIEKSDKKNNRSENIEDYKKILSKCIKDNLNIFRPVKDISEDNSETFIYLVKIWEKEKYIAESLYNTRTFDRGESSCSDEDIEDAEKDISKFDNKTIELDDSQKEAIKSAFNHKITVITGAGGTGKSTICRCIYHLANEKRLSIRMMSPTGKAAQVLSGKTGGSASTIHRSLRMTPDDDYPRDMIAEDIVIVDEFSMVGIDTMYAIMFAIKKDIGCNLVFVGDCNQLPSVSPGNFLSDIINSGCANVIKLNRIHRQSENSYISLLANDVSTGKVVDIPENALDIRWHTIHSESDFGDDIKKEIKSFMDNGNIDDLQILSPMYKGNCGINLINQKIQELMVEINNSEERYVQRGYDRFYIGDRIIQTENNYEKEIFNGDMGRIVDVGKKVIDPTVNDKEENYISVNFYGSNIFYIENEIDQIKLAWATSIHKFQGSQSPNIILVITEENTNMASKELLYTAMTRAEAQLDIYGHKNIFQLCPTKSVIRKRYTNLNKMIKELRENRKILQVAETQKTN